VTGSRLKPAPIDLKAVVLTPEEGFVLSRLDGPVDADQIAGLTGLASDRVAAVVARLLEVGALVPIAGATAAALPSLPPGAAFASQPPGAVLDPLAGAGGLDAAPAVPSAPAAHAIELPVEVARAASVAAPPSRAEPSRGELSEAFLPPASGRLRLPPGLPPLFDPGPEPVEPVAPAPAPPTAVGARPSPAVPRAPAPPAATTARPDGVAAGADVGVSDRTTRVTPVVGHRRSPPRAPASLQNEARGAVTPYVGEELPEGVTPYVGEELPEGVTPYVDEGSLPSVGELIPEGVAPYVDEGSLPSVGEPSPEGVGADVVEGAGATGSELPGADLEDAAGVEAAAPGGGEDPSAVGPGSVGDVFAAYAAQFRRLGVAERIAIAKDADDPDLLTLCLDPDPQVIGAILANPRSGPFHARRIALHHRTSAGIDHLCRRAELFRDSLVQRNLLRNPQLADTVLQRITAGKQLLDLHKLCLDREIPEQGRLKLRADLRRRFNNSSADEKVELVIRTEGRVLSLLSGCTFDAKSAATLAQRTITSLMLVQNLARFPATPPAVLAKLVALPMVARQPAIKQLLLRHPNLPGDAKRRA